MMVTLKYFLQLVVRGNLKTEITYSREYTENERCEYYRDVERCYQDNNGRRYCRYERERFYGYRWVRYFYEIETQYLIFDLFQDNKLVSNYDGKYKNERKEYLDEGYCR
jgi:hypothetical protein